MDKVATEAAIWLARIERGLQTQDAVLLREWLLQSAHREGIVNAAKLWHGPDIVAVLAQLVPVGFGNPKPPISKGPRTFAIVVGTLLALCTLGPFIPFLVTRTLPALFGSHYKVPARSASRDEEIYDTKTGETRAIQLPDDSRLLMNQSSTLYVLYAASGREATVAQGEAIFEVRKGLDPFRIFAGQRHFVAPAGRFDVQIIGPRTVKLTVLEGDVTVRGLPYKRPQSPAEARSFDPSVFADATIGPLQSVQLDNGTLTRQLVTAAEAREQLAWQPPDH